MIFGLRSVIQLARLMGECFILYVFLFDAYLQITTIVHRKRAASTEAARILWIHLFCAVYAALLVELLSVDGCLHFGAVGVERGGHTGQTVFVGVRSCHLALLFLCGGSCVKVLGDNADDKLIAIQLIDFRCIVHRLTAPGIPSGSDKVRNLLESLSAGVKLAELTL
jgi:hypothetical protein